MSLLLCQIRTLAPSMNSLLVSYPCRPFGGESGDRGSLEISPSAHLPILALFSLPGMWMAGCMVLKCLPFFRSLATCRPGAWVSSHKASSIMPDVSRPERRPPNLFANVSTQQVRNGLTAAAEGWEVKTKGEEGWNGEKWYEFVWGPVPIDVVQFENAVHVSKVDIFYPH